jgi:hypothetical protein
MLVSDGAKTRVKPEIRSGLKTTTSIADRKFWFVPANKGAGENCTAQPEWHSAPLAFQIATYAEAMGHIRQRIDATFGPSRILLSESSQLPFTTEI